jgi:hypothetical protein
MRDIALIKGVVVGKVVVMVASVTVVIARVVSTVVAVMGVAAEGEVATEIKGSVDSQWVA